MAGFKFSDLFSKKSIPTKDPKTDPKTQDKNAASSSPALFTAQIKLPNPSGLHARPAANLVKLAKSFKAVTQMSYLENTANLKSIVDILNLETHKDALVTLTVSGEDAQLAFEALNALIIEGCGEDCSEQAPVADLNISSGAVTNINQIGLTTADLESLTPEQCFKGVSVSDGLALGTIFILEHAKIKITKEGLGTKPEIEILEKAIAAAKAQLEKLSLGVDNKTQKEVIEAHLGLLDDPSLFEKTCITLKSAVSAAFAWKKIIDEEKVKLLASTSNILAERANDLEDIGNRVLRIITGQAEKTLTLPDQCILIAKNLTPSDTIKLDRTKVVAFATVEGGATSHVAILARAMNLPALCAIPENALELKAGSAIIDTKSAQLIINPSAHITAQVHGLLDQLKNLNDDVKRNAQALATTLDGITIDVVANVTAADETLLAIENGAEGVGLLRTEILFVDSPTEPSEDEQVAIYSGIAKACGTERPLVLRTLDIGGDKPVPYINIPAEDNPFLGLRGLRLCLSMPEMFRRQIRAILKSAQHTKMHIMFPMVTNISELLTAKKMVEEERTALGITQIIPIGIMVEVPAAALLAEHFAPHVDFFSIGTNDLTQYTLAMDRGHAALAKDADAYHPAVLGLIGKTCDAANKHGKWVGVCGGLASDSNASALLIGLGVKELSASGNSIPHVKAMIRSLNMSDCKVLAQKALLAESAQAVRALIK